MNYLILQRFLQYAPFIVAATASLVLLAHGLHFGPLDDLGPGGPN